jgi:predicted oxidoreductase
MPTDADVIVVGAGLAGLVATAELADAGKKVLLLDQEPAQSLGGQAFWSLGGLFLVDTPEQRRMGVKDSYDLALQDWMGSAQFDRESDYWPRKWAEAYVGFAAGEKRQWLYDQGLRVFPVVGWAERGGGLAGGHGNSVPRFHLTWGTGPGVVAPFERRVREAVAKGLVELCHRHRVDDLVMTDGVCTGVTGALLAGDDMERGRASNRDVIGDFTYNAQAVIVTSGGIGGNHDQVRKQWPVERLGQPPKFMVAGVPAHVDGRMQFITEAAGGEIINPDRMWHYTEGLRNWNPIWENHGIRVLPGPSSLWLSATGERFPAPYLPGFDTLGTLGAIMRTGYEYSWFVLTQKVIEKEFALSGSEQNPDLTGKDIKLLLSRVKAGAPGPVEAFKEHGEDFVVADTVSELVAGMNRVAGSDLITVDGLTKTITERDRELDNSFSKDVQITYMRQHRSYRGDKLIRVASPHKFNDPKNGPLIAVRLNILTRKTLGGLHTDLDARVLRPDGEPLPGVYAAGEVAGFGGGGVHGYNALEGTFLGGCIFSGRTAGRAAAKAIG